MVWVAIAALALLWLASAVTLGRVLVNQAQLAQLAVLSAKSHQSFVEMFIQEAERLQIEINEGNDLSAAQTERILEMRNYLLWQASRDQYAKYDEPKTLAESDRN